MAQLFAAAVALVSHGCTGNVFPGDMESTGASPCSDCADHGNNPYTPRQECEKSIPDCQSDALGTAALSYAGALGPSVARRLTRWELQNAFTALVDVPTAQLVELLPEDTVNATVGEGDVVTPFDNDFSLQQPSGVLVRNLAAVAEEVADASMVRARTNAEYTAALMGCTPKGFTDAACMETFVREFGRRALRRPLDDEEVSEIAAFASTVAEVEQDFFAGARIVLWTLFQDLEFIYRVEVGEAVEGYPGFYRLTPDELATRLSFLLWGSIPDIALLDAAQAGELSTREGVEAQFDRLLEDPRAAKQLAHFHQLWFGYTEGIPVEAKVAEAMYAETEALLDRVLLQESRNWFDMVRADETFVTPALAEHYQMPATSEPGWVKYPEGERTGFFGHATFLAQGALAGDTSPTRRGLLIQANLFCHHIAPPTPEQLAALGAEDINVDAPPPGDGCKSDRYAMHAQGGCASCHQQTDPVGFGLERYDTAGAFREHENGRPECEIEGQGQLRGRPFSGPAGLASAVLAEQDVVAQCMARQALQYALGRAHLPSQGWDDSRIQAELGQAIVKTDYDLVHMLRLLATSPAFAHRVEANGQEGAL